MDEWQPVRIAFTPPHNNGKWRIEAQAANAGIVVRVRKRKTTSLARFIMAEVGCDSEFLYEVHQDDMGKLAVHDKNPFLLCEHEILAD